MIIPLDFLTNSALAKSVDISTDCPVWPYLAYYTYKSKQAFNELGELSDNDQSVIINGFLHNLTARVTATANNVLFAERSILKKTAPTARVTVKEHYKILRNTTSYLHDILTAYPELDRLLETISHNFFEQSLRLAKNLICDKTALSKIANINNFNSLKKCEVSEGETHNGSATVCILTFCNGERIVYKPRNLELESSVSTLLRNLSDNAGGDYSEWTIPNYIVGSDHGWTQYVPQLPAQSQLQVAQFYKRSGFLLGFCTAFTASDITSDNLIAHASSPIPIDLETIFYNVLNIDSIPKEIRWNATQTSILPNWTWKGTDGIGVDLSALGGLNEQYVSLNLYQHIEDKHGNDSFGMDGVKILPGKNVLYFKGRVVKPWEYYKEITEGFHCVFQLIEKQKESLISFISLLSGLPCRYVPRATATYHYAIQCSLHASLMSSSENRRAFLKKILDNETAPAIGFLEAEIQACMNLDIPYAKSQVGQLEFFEPCYLGKGHLNSLEYVDGLTNSIDYLRNLSTCRTAFETSLIKNTLIAMQNMYEHDKRLTDHEFRQHDCLDNIANQSSDSILHAVRLAQNRNVEFINTQITDELSTNGLWLGFHASPGGYVEYSELGDDYYYGLSGILYGCILAGQWVAVSKDATHDLLNHVYTRVHTKLTNPGSHLGGLHFGLSSTILPLYISLKFYKDDRSNVLLSMYKSYLNDVITDGWWQKYFWGNDLLSGSFGTLTVVTRLYELTNDSEFSLLGKALYGKIESELSIVNGRNMVTFGKSITTRDDGLLSGISHGVMGCAYAIFYFNNTVMQSESIDSVFSDFLDWELSEFDSGIDNWKDYRRRSADASPGEFSWSHGLPGNYLALRYFASKGIHEAITFLEKNPPNKLFTFDRLLKRKRPVNDSLCHGAYGLLNLMKELNPEALSDYRTYIWANVLNLAEHDIRELRTRSADPLGLWVGKVGSLLGSIGLLNENFKFPFLAHEMKLI